jgi:predicted HTH domain antitoxin
MIRTNVMLTPQQHMNLKQASASMHRTLGELVRDAIDSTFPRDKIERRHHVALAAYREGFISLGKLAESLGVDPLTTRDYLRERGIQIMTQSAEEITADAANA